MEIYICPECKKYLPKTREYKYCPNCGCVYNMDKLILEFTNEEKKGGNKDTYTQMELL